jgi:hypothetical protein
VPVFLFARLLETEFCVDEEAGAPYITKVPTRKYTVWGSRDLLPGNLLVENLLAADSEDGFFDD